MCEELKSVKVNLNPFCNAMHHLWKAFLRRQIEPFISSVFAVDHLSSHECQCYIYFHLTLTLQKSAVYYMCMYAQWESPLKFKAIWMIIIIIIMINLLSPKFFIRSSALWHRLMVNLAVQAVHTLCKNYDKLFPGVKWIHLWN